jgi:hypothetical protein
MALSFMVVAVTGTLMLLHIKSRALGHLHEWMGIFFVVAGITHVLLNWETLKAYLRQRPMQISLAVVLLLSLALLSGGSQGPHGQKNKPSHEVRVFGNR